MQIQIGFFFNDRFTQFLFEYLLCFEAVIQTCRQSRPSTVLIREELRGRAQGAGLPTYTVTDAGRTQVWLQR